MKETTARRVVLTVVISLAIYSLACIYAPVEWSPDSKKIAVLVQDEDNNEEYSEIWLGDPAGEEMKLLAKSALGLSQPVWLPDGKRLIYWKALAEEDNIVGGELLIAHAETLESELLARCWLPEIRPWAPFAIAVSPLGHRVAYLSWAAQSGEGEADLVVLDLRTKERRVVPVLVGMTPSWSPDGKWIALRAGVDSDVHPEGLNAHAVRLFSADMKVAKYVFLGEVHEVGYGLGLAEEAEDAWDESPTLSRRLAQEARDILQAFLARYPDSKFTQKAILGQAKALLVGGRSAEALARTQKFIQDFPRSEETSDARELIARCYLRLHRYEEAANALGKAAELAKDEKQAKSLVKECQELRNSLAEYEAVKQRIKSAAHRAELPALYLQLAKLCEEQLARFGEAQDAYGQLLLKYPQRKEAEGVEEKILRLQELAERSSEAELRMAAVAVSLLNLMDAPPEEAPHIAIREHAEKALKLLEAFATKYPKT